MTRSLPIRPTSRWATRTCARATCASSRAARSRPGVTGLSALATIVAGARDRLVPGGFLAVEHGFDQGDAVRGLFEAAGFVAVEASRDLAGIWRVVVGQAPITL